MKTTQKVAITSTLISTVIILSAYFGMEHIWPGFWNGIWWLLPIMWVYGVGKLYKETIKDEVMNNLANMHD